MIMADNYAQVRLLIADFFTTAVKNIMHCELWLVYEKNVVKACLTETATVVYFDQGISAANTVVVYFNTFQTLVKI